MGDDCPYTTVCFHAQQCIEKYIKALLVHRGIDFPKTHDLGRLVRFLPPDVAMPLSKSEAEILTDYATVTRYPGDWVPVTRVEAQEAVHLAQRVRDALRVAASFRRALD
jgi:HEPN domain-containing protein